jgi:lincosamide nucleotidyltransferase A/C/D/E
MELQSAVELVDAFNELGLAFWIDGGWGVDALLGEQTRPHSDLDLAVERRDLPAFAQCLEQLGYVRAARPDNPDWNWVLANSHGLSVDLHGFTPDDCGNGILGDPSNGDMYPAAAFDGRGRLGGRPVRCIAPQVVLGFRNGFEPRAVDHHDVNALCVRFGLALPSRFQAAQGSR